MRKLLIVVMCVLAIGIMATAATAAADKPDAAKSPAAITTAPGANTGQAGIVLPDKIAKAVTDKYPGAVVSSVKLDKDVYSFTLTTKTDGSKSMTATDKDGKIAIKEVPTATKPNASSAPPPTGDKQIVIATSAPAPVPDQQRK